jgi:hypothetical protein
MRITKAQLRQIIKEEVKKALIEPKLDKPKRKCKPSERKLSGNCIRGCGSDDECCESDFCENGKCTPGC